jgi:TPR repeat protein
LSGLFFLVNAHTALVKAEVSQTQSAPLSSPQASADADVVSQGELLITGGNGQTNPTEGRRILEEAANKGSIRAKAVLGKFLFEGYYLPKDATRGLSLLEDAANSNDSSALSTLGAAYLWDGAVKSSPEKALDYLTRGTALGDPDARLILGEQLVTGWVLPQDTAKGLALLDEAISNGDKRARTALGKHLLDGYYIKDQISRGETLLTQSADEGDANAMLALGSAYLWGGSVKADPLLAMTYLDKAASAGNTDAARLLGEQLYYGWVLPKDEKRGMDLLETAAATKDPKSKISLGKAFLNGKPDQRKTKRAIELFEEAAKSGDYEGIEAYGTHLMWGAKSNRERRDAEAYLLKAAKSGRASAWLSLAEGSLFSRFGTGSVKKFAEYSKAAVNAGQDKAAVLQAQQLYWGTGVKQDTKRALSLLESAAAKGNPEALKYLVQMVRDGDGWSIKPSKRKARDYLTKYGKALSKNELVEQVVIIDASTVYSTDEFAGISLKLQDLGGNRSTAFHKQLYKANPNLAVYLVQERMRNQNLYSGNLNGKLTKSTIDAMRKACEVQTGSAKCTNNILSADSVAALLMGS